MTELREEILNLLESPELLEYLLSNPEKLCGFDYANIIAGAPIGLFEKRALLEKLKNSAKLRSDPDFGKAISQVGLYLRFRRP